MLVLELLLNLGAVGDQAVVWACQAPPPTPRDSKLIQHLSSLSEFSISRSGIVYILRVYTERTIIPNLKDMVWPGTVLELLNDFLKGRLYFLTNLRYFSLGST